MSIKVFIADDHAVFRNGLRALLEKEETIEVVGEAGSGIQALDQIQDLEVDVLLLDVNMPGMSGPDVVRRLKTIRPKLKIVMLTMHDEAYYVQELFKLDVKGYVLKKSTGTELVRAILAVYGGESYLDSALVNMVVSNYVGTEKIEKEGRLDLLSQREKEVCTLLVLGHSHTEIGEMLNISSRTVESHRAHIMSKLELESRAGLVQFALDYGLLKPSREE